MKSPMTVKQDRVFEDKKIVLGICGGIAAFKAASVASSLRKKGASIRVIMTRNAREFVDPTTFRTLSGYPVATGLFEAGNEPVHHVSLAEWADLLVVVPATANILGKVAAGIADDLLSTTIMACPQKVIFAPAMNDRMYANPIVQKNIQKLKDLDYVFIAPEEGFLACGTEGRGRLAAPETIVCSLRPHFLPQDLEGRRVIVTAGATREFFDPVRFLSNPSTGKMGYALAESARDRGAEVVLITGASKLSPPREMEVIPVENTEEMFTAVLEHFPDCDAVIKAAAVSDYRPQKVHKEKIKKEADSIELKLIRNPDILMSLGQKKTHQKLIGFAAETGDLVANAKEKLEKKNLDLIVANDLLKKGAGFGSDTNEVTVIRRDGSLQSIPIMEKRMVADLILDELCVLFEQC